MSRNKKHPRQHFGHLTGPYRDEYNHSNARGGRKALLFVLAGGVLLIFALLLVLIYRQGVRSSPSELPVISGDDRPYKRRMDESQGREMEGQDEGIYAAMDGLGDPAAPGSDNGAVSLRRGDPVLTRAEPPPPPPANESSVLDDNSGFQSSGDTDGALPPAPQSVQAGSEDRPLTGTEPQAEMAANSPFVADGQFQVQLAALRNAEAAVATWDSIRDKAPDLYRGARLNVQKADLGTRGVFYRLRIGSFTSRESASVFCTRVKATGQDCLVVASDPE